MEELGEEGEVPTDSVRLLGKDLFLYQFHSMQAWNDIQVQSLSP